MQRFSILSHRFSVFSVVVAFCLFFSIPAIAAYFPDVPDSDPHFNSVEYLREAGIIEGYSDGTFRPENPINRAETLKILLLGSNIEVYDSVSDVSYSDFKANEWFSRYVETATFLEIVGGYPDGTFRPAKTVNLAENLKMLLRANDVDVDALYADDLLEDPYFDTPKDSWYAKYVRYAKDKHLLDTDSSDMIYPDQPMTRASFSELVYRFMLIRRYSLEYFDPTLFSRDTSSVDSTNFSEDLDQIETYLEELNTDDWSINYDELWAEIGF